MLLYRFQRSKFWNILISLIVVANLSLIWVEVCPLIVEVNGVEEEEARGGGFVL